jgi:hypothetical protein
MFSGGISQPSGVKRAATDRRRAGPTANRMKSTRSVTASATTVTTVRNIGVSRPSSAHREITANHMIAAVAIRSDRDMTMRPRRTGIS